MAYQRYVILTFVVIAILTGMAVQAATASAFAQFAVADHRVLGLVNLSTLSAVISALVAFGVLIRHPRTVPFTREVVSELAKVTWPSKDETVKGSITVAATTLFTATLLGAYDVLWKNLAQLVLFNK